MDNTNMNILDNRSIVGEISTSDKTKEQIESSFPTLMKVETNTIAQELVSVNPMDCIYLTDEEKTENERKKSVYKREVILTTIDGRDSSKVEEPVLIEKREKINSDLFYIDFKYAGDEED